MGGQVLKDGGIERQDVRYSGGPRCFGQPRMLVTQCGGKIATVWGGARDRKGVRVKGGCKVAARPKVGGVK